MLQVIAEEAVGDEGIDRIMNGSVNRFGDVGTLRSNESPVLFIFRAFRDPLADKLLLLLVEFEVRVRRWHDIIGISAGDPLPDEGLFGLAGNDGLPPVTAGEGSFRHIEAQFGFTGILIEAVAFEAAVR